MVAHTGLMGIAWNTGRLASVASTLGTVIDRLPEGDEKSALLAEVKNIDSIIEGLQAGTDALVAQGVRP